jgi:hypothetical protein
VEVRIIDGTMPDHWVAFRDEESGSFKIGPEPWHEAEFWVRYFDSDEEACRAYEENLPLELRNEASG